MIIYISLSGAGIVSYLPPCLMKFDDNAWESDEMYVNLK
jgi:hypothetical protein